MEEASQPAEQEVQPPMVSAEVVPNQDPGITEPSKLIRIASMTRAMLDEVRQAPIDEGGRARLVEVHRRSIEELKEVLPPPLLDEFNEVFLPVSGENATPSELRIAQAQLIGWLEGLFHGIQASLLSQQMAAQAQLAEMQRRAQLTGHGEEQPSGLYL